MGFTDPTSVHVPSTGTIAPASWGTTVNADLNYLNDPDRVKVYLGADQSIANTTLTAVTWGNESWDNANLHSISVNTSRLTAAVAGRYLVLGRLFWEVNGTGYRVAELWKNGVSTGTFIDADTEPSPGAATYASVGVHVEIDLVATDYLELAAYQSSGGALHVLGTAATYRSWFLMRRISA